MLKTHAERLAAVLKQRERYHNPDMKVTVLDGGGRRIWSVHVIGSSGLIDMLTADHTSSEYAENSEQRRRRIGPTEMEFY